MSSTARCSYGCRSGAPQYSVPRSSGCASVECRPQRRTPGPGRWRRSSPDTRSRTPPARSSRAGPARGPALAPRSTPAPSCAASASKSASRFGIVCKSCRSQMHRTPAGETRTPSLANSFAIRTCPHAGCSIASATTRCSISGAMRFERIRFPSRDLRQRLGPASVVQLREPIGAVPAVADHLTGLAHIPSCSKHGGFKAREVRSTTGSKHDGFKARRVQRTTVRSLDLQLK